MTIKVTGRQWAWEYAYPDNGGFSFISNMIADDELKPGASAPARRSTTGSCCRPGRTSAS